MTLSRAARVRYTSISVIATTVTIITIVESATVVGRSCALRSPEKK